MSNVTAPASESAATRSPAPAISPQIDARAARPNLNHRPLNRRRRPDWVAWLLAASALGAAIAAAVSLGLVPSEFSRAVASAYQRAAAVVTSITRPPSREAGMPDQVLMRGQDQEGPVNQPVPLGLSISGGSGRETVVLDGLPEGTNLSVGTSLSSRGWSLPAKDLDKAFVGAPPDFSGAMEVAAKLYSAHDELLQTVMIRLTWQAAQVQDPPAPAALQPAPAPPAPSVAPATQLPDPWWLSTTSLVPAPIDSGPTNAIAGPNGPGEAASVHPPARPVTPSKDTAPPPAVAKATSPPPSAEEVDALFQVGRRLLWEGDIAAARVALQRAAEAGNAQAAQDLGMSFDPVFLRQIGSPAAPDLAQAADWYARAGRLGLRR